MEKAKKSKKKLIIDIVSYVLLGICLLLATIGIILRISGNNFYLFGYRFDVVLTDSMSQKNPIWKDFLEGHDNQIQAFDLVVSKQVESKNDLAVYDIVIFENKQIGTDMHRIVGMEPNTNDQITISKSHIETINNYEGILMPEIDSGFASSAISISEITLVTYSQSDYEGSHFNFNVQGSDLTPVITTESVNGGYLKTYYVSRTSTSPGKLIISHKYDYDYLSEIVTSCRILNAQDPIEVNKETVSVEGEDLVGKYNYTYLYEIRGDKAPNSDGKFTIDKIMSKVTNTLPKMGYVVRFLSSIWGSIMFIGFGVIIIAFDILSAKIKKEEQSSEAPESEVVEEEKKDE